MKAFNMITHITELTPTDRIQFTGTERSAIYVVIQIWQQPIVRENQTFPDFRTIGFTLYDVSSSTDKEVDAIELQAQIDSGNWDWYVPATVRKIPGMTPEAHNTIKFPKA